ncbi:MAG: hypothetical protein RJQ21_07685 [Rhodospirillales bacterium]
MALTASEETALRAAFMEIQRERRLSLQRMFEGTQLKPKSLLQDAKDMAKEANKTRKAMQKVPGINVPDVNLPSLNVGLFKGIDLRKLVDIDLPPFGLPGWKLSLVPNWRLGDIPGFNLPRVRINLKGIIKYKDLLPDIRLPVLVWSIGVNFPHLSLPSVLWDLEKIFGINLNLPDLFPEFAVPDFSVNLPNVALPDISLPHVNVPSIDLDFPTINLSAIDIPDFDLSMYMKIPGFDGVLKLLFELFDAVDLPDIIAEIGLDFLTDFISGALPIVQQLKSGKNMIKEWGKAAQEFHKSRQVKKHMPFILPGNARDACLAVQRLLQESSAEHAGLATTHSAQFAVSTAGLFADLGAATGPATSAVAAAARTCQKVVIFAAKYKEMKKINAILRDNPGNTLTSNIFEISPLLGCYYLANNTTSNVLNILCDNILMDNWMMDAENNKKKHLDPLIKESQRFIDKSRYVLSPIRQSKGMYVQRGYFEKKKEAAGLYFKKKFGLAPQDAKVKSHRYIG